MKGVIFTPSSDGENFALEANLSVFQYHNELEYNSTICMSDDVYVRSSSFYTVISVRLA